MGLVAGRHDDLSLQAQNRSGTQAREHFSLDPKHGIANASIPDVVLILKVDRNVDLNLIFHAEALLVNNQIEVDVPINFQNQNHVWYGGVGDTVLGVKREMFASLRSGSILSLQGEVIVPTGNKTHSLGTGTTTFETFAAFDQLFPTNTFVQFQMGADLPRHTDISPQSVFWLSALGQSFAADHGLGRLWSPMVEFLADRELTRGAKTNWDLVPQMQVTISRRQHIKANLGVRTPVSNTAGRPVQLMFYVLWDWQDGKLTEGW